MTEELSRPCPSDPREIKNMYVRGIDSATGARYDSGEE